MINPNSSTGNYASGNPLVHIRAIPEGGAAGTVVATNLPYTFYDRYTPRTTPAMDRRQPLPAAFTARYIQGGTAAFRTIPATASPRARARLRIFRFDRFSDPYYALRRGDEHAREELELRLGELDAAVQRDGYLTGDAYGLADVAYLPWIVRAQRNLRVDLDAQPALRDWLERLSERPAVAAELELVAALA